MAQGKSRADDLAVDVVQVRRGPKLLGAVLHRSGQGDVTLAVERDWLRQADRKFFTEQTARETEESRTAWQELITRLEAWKTARTGDDRLIGFIESELARAKKRLAALDQPQDTVAAPQFLIIDLTSKQIDRVQQQPADKRQVALVAWQEQLPDVAQRSASSLKRELERRDIKVEAEHPNLSDRLPIRRQTEAEWLARRAILEYAERKAVDFQGTGDLLVRTGDAKPQANLTQLLTQVLQSQLTSTLEDLLNEGAGGKPAGRKPTASALEKARQEARQAGANGFRATRLDLEVDQGRVRVEGTFVARTGEKKWQRIWRTEEVLPAGGGKEQRERIRNDPQVKQALELLSSTGLAANDALDTALGFGAATMTAQDHVNERFGQFLGIYRQHADGPPLFLPESE